VELEAVDLFQLELTEELDQAALMVELMEEDQVIMHQIMHQLVDQSEMDINNNMQAFIQQIQ
jgi:hypothetical protein